MDKILSIKRIAVIGDHEIYARLCHKTHKDTLCYLIKYAGGMQGGSSTDNTLETLYKEAINKTIELIMDKEINYENYIEENCMGLIEVIKK